MFSRQYTENLLDTGSRVKHIKHAHQPSHEINNSMGVTIMKVST